MTRSMTRLLVTLVAISALAGCGKAAATAPSNYGVVDSVFTKLPSKQAQRQAASEETQRRDTSTNKPETTKVGAPGSDANGLLGR